MNSQLNSRRPKPQTEAKQVPRKTEKDLGQKVERVSPQSQNKVVQGAPSNAPAQNSSSSSGISQKITNAAKNVKQTLFSSSQQKQSKSGKHEEKNNQKNTAKQIKNQNEDWTDKYKSGESEVKKSLKKGNNDLSAQLSKFYEGMLKNCLKQSEDEPHKMQKCWDEISSKMKPVYQKMNESSSQSAQALKKCFESKKNAQACVDQSIKFGQKYLNDATNSIKSYLA